jgi:hypothetical protein
MKTELEPTRMVGLTINPPTKLSRGRDDPPTDEALREAEAADQRKENEHAEPDAD